MKTAFKWAAWTCVLIIVALSLLPSDEMMRTGADGHLEHAAAYAGTAFFFGMAYSAESRLAGIAGSLVTLAGTMELLQHFSPGRHPAFSDFAASSLGALLGLAVAGLALRHAPRAQARG
jgi:hypothetical protein